MKQHHCLLVHLDSSGWNPRRHSLHSVANQDNPAFVCIKFSHLFEVTYAPLKISFFKDMSPTPLCCCCCSVSSVVSDSVRPQRWQPTRLPCPWGPPGKNTGVGCHFLLQCMKVKSESEVAQSCPTLSDPMDCSLPGSSVHGIFQARVLEWAAIAFSETSI